MKEIEPRRSIDAVVKIPGSKSITHRALITSSLAEGESILDAFLSCEDTLYTVNALRDMGVRIKINGENAQISGIGGRFPVHRKKNDLFLGNSGTSFRLLLSVAALGQGEYIFRGGRRMNERPVGDLVKALKILGVNVLYIEKHGFPPVLIRAGGMCGGKVNIPGNISSQYISSILLTAPYAMEEVEIKVEGDLVSSPYVDLTLDIMRAFGVDVYREGYEYFKIPCGIGYRSRSFVIEGDVSSASYFWGAAAITGGRVITENIHPLKTRQGDIAFLDILERMGCIIIRDDDRVTVEGCKLSGVEVDMGSLPDMVPTLAAVALFAEGTTTIRNVAHLRYKESDRIGDTVLEWRKMGSGIKETEDGIIITGGARLSGAELDPHNDHRLAMSLAMAGLNIPGIRIRDEECVAKSFPTFWDLWESL